MDNFTTNTYEMKRDILKFSKKICNGVSKPETKFVSDMLIESFWENPVFVIDDSDIIKPLGQQFEDLGIVRDGSSKDKSYEKGYHVTEIVGLTENKKQPISIFSSVHSSTSRDYVSNNTVTFNALDTVISMLDDRKRTGIFVHDRGYDNNAFFKYYVKNKQNYIIRLKENRIVYRNHKWDKITTLRDSRKGKVKMNIFFQGEQKECYVSVLRVQITAEKRWINLILVYGLGETPMMLASNISLKSKDDLIKVVRCYINRWRIEEYFKFKKQEYHFENLRVRSLKVINNLNKMLSYVIGLIGLLSEKIGKREFVNKIIKESKSLRESVYLWFY